MDIKQILFILAAVCFALGAAGAPRLNWQNAGLCLLTVAVFLV